MTKYQLPFAPPPPYRGKRGDYRSVLFFDNGQPVQSKADWPRRRTELLAYWHGVLGPWLTLLTKPRAVFRESQSLDGFTRTKVELETAPGAFQATWLLVPEGPGPFTAVVVPWYGIDDSAGVTDLGKSTVAFGYDLARRGFITLCLGGPPSGPKALQPLSWLAYVAANANIFLRAYPKVAPERIGIIGHSFGGKWALFASCLDTHFACAVWSDPGIVWNEADANANYWEPWYLGFDPALPQQRKPGIPSGSNPRTGAYKRLIDEHRDLHELHALMAPRPFLVSGGAQDLPEHWVALNHTIAINTLLGVKDRIAFTQRNGHTPTAASNEQVYAFFEQFLKSTPPRDAGHPLG